jgi:hypothetical protein
MPTSPVKFPDLQRHVSKPHLRLHSEVSTNYGASSGKYLVIYCISRLRCRLAFFGCNRSTYSPVPVNLKEIWAGTNINNICPLNVRSDETLSIIILWNSENEYTSSLNSKLRSTVLSALSASVTVFTRRPVIRTLLYESSGCPQAGARCHHALFSA